MTRLYFLTKPKCLKYGHCHFVLTTSFGAQVCAVVIVRWSGSINVLPRLLQTQSQAHNHNTTPLFYSIKTKTEFTKTNT